MNQAITMKNSMLPKKHGSIKKVCMSLTMAFVFVFCLFGTGSADTGSNSISTVLGIEAGSVAYAAKEEAKKEEEASKEAISKTEAYGTTNPKLNSAITNVIKLVGGTGGLLFTLAILIIAVIIIFGSISAAKMRTVWVSLISCCIGALIFYSAYFLSGVIAGIAG